MVYLGKFKTDVLAIHKKETVENIKCTFTLFEFQEMTLLIHPH